MGKLLLQSYLFLARNNLRQPEAIAESILAYAGWGKESRIIIWKVFQGVKLRIFTSIIKFNSIL